MKSINHASAARRTVEAAYYATTGRDLPLYESDQSLAEMRQSLIEICSKLSIKDCERLETVFDTVSRYNAPFTL